MNRLSTLLFAVAILIVSLAAVALVVRSSVVTPAWAPVPASAEQASAADDPGSSARF